MASVVARGLLTRIVHNFVPNIMKNCFQNFCLPILSARDRRCAQTVARLSVNTSNSNRRGGAMREQRCSAPMRDLRVVPGVRLFSTFSAVGARASPLDRAMAPPASLRLSTWFSRRGRRGAGRSRIPVEKHRCGIIPVCSSERIAIPLGYCRIGTGGRPVPPSESFATLSSQSLAGQITYEEEAR